MKALLATVLALQALAIAPLLVIATGDYAAAVDELRQSSEQLRRACGVRPQLRTAPYHRGIDL